MKRLSKIIIILLIFLTLGFLLLLIRGSEDRWICENGEWVRHGVPSASKPTELCPNNTSEEKSGTEELNVKVGEKFQITLDSNPTTGYQWQVNFDSDYIELTNKSYAPAANELIVGAGGKDTFTFLAKKPGETQIILSYLRPWEKDTPPIEKRVYQIIIGSIKE